MSSPPEGYAPGWTADAVQMMAHRSATGRAQFCLRRLLGGERVIDLGCGPGTITEGLAAAVGETGQVIGLDSELSQLHVAQTGLTSTARTRYAAASAYALPLPDNSVDMVFSHALFEHLSKPLSVLAEARRVLRAGGRLAVAASDWGRARLQPATPDVSEALQGHYALRQRAGGDPFAGAALASQIQQAGFVDVESQEVHRPDLSYGELAAYVLARLRQQGPQYARAAEAAERWRATPGTFAQCWQQVSGRKPA